MSHPVCKKLERALGEYLFESFDGTGGVLEGVTIYEGHRSGAIEQQDHVVVVASDPGGDLMQAGIYEVQVQVLLVTFSVPQEEDAEDPAVRHAARAEELVGLFSQERMGYVVEWVNLSAAVYGVGASGYEVGAGQDARDGQVFASTVPMTWTAHLV